jgi:glycine dehydrogenase subunit 2
MAAEAPVPVQWCCPRHFRLTDDLPITERHADGRFSLVEEETVGERHPHSFGRMTAFHGQMGMFTRALSYIMSHGADGLRQVAEDAVLNANYVLRSLEGTRSMRPSAHSGPCMHEALFTDDGLAEGFTTLDIAKGLIDEGYHPMTVYFPLVVHGAMLIEPTETESKATLDQFIGAHALRGQSRESRAIPRSNLPRTMRRGAVLMKRWQPESPCWSGKSLKKLSLPNE